MAIRCDGIPLPDYKRYEYRRILPFADGLITQLDYTQLINIIFKVVPIETIRTVYISNIPGELIYKTYPAFSYILSAPKIINSLTSA